LDNGVTGAFHALAMDNQVLGAAIPVGGILTISAALTAYTGPASFSSFDPTNSIDLLNVTGPLPQDSLSDVSGVPEPGTWMLLTLGLPALLLIRKRNQEFRGAGLA
jgi:hypothetical protein